MTYTLCPYPALFRSRKTPGLSTRRNLDRGVPGRKRKRSRRQPPSRSGAACNDRRSWDFQPCRYGSSPPRPASHRRRGPSLRPFPLSSCPVPSRSPPPLSLLPPSPPLSLYLYSLPPSSRHFLPTFSTSISSSSFLFFFLLFSFLFLPLLLFFFFFFLFFLF